MAMVIERRVSTAPLVLGALVVLALMAALATLVGGGRTASPREVGAVTPTKVFLPIPNKVSTTVVDEAPAPAVHGAKPRVARQPAAQTGASRPAQGVGAATGGGDTNVTIDNGSSNTETESGGAHVGNNADVSASSSSTSAEDEGP